MPTTNGMGVTVVAWHRYGKRRSYVNDADGTSLGYRDEDTGEVHVTVAARADAVRHALATMTPVSPNNLRFARQSWHAPTLSEKALADELARASPYAWQREVPVGPYRPDFWCEAAALVVEVDGSSHRRRGERDAERDTWFAERGIRTVRVTAEDVERDPAAVVARLNRECVLRTGRVPATEVPAPGLVNRLLGRTRPVSRDPLAPPEYAGRRRGTTFVCARCRQERTAAERSAHTTSCCTSCASLGRQ